MPDTTLDPDAIALARTAARAADSKSASSTVILGVGPVLGICEAFVVTSASNRRLVKAVAEEVEHQVRAAHDRSPRRTEGTAEQQWLLIDYGDVVIHVFSEEMRAFYDIERLYRDVRKVSWSPEEGDGSARSPEEGDGSARSPEEGDGSARSPEEGDGE